MSDLNDPRVFFAAERTALAWNRTALALIAFGFAIERFGLFVHMMEKDGKSVHHGASFWLGLTFIVLGCVFSSLSAMNYKRIVKTLKPVEIPSVSNPNLAFVLNIIIAVLALAMMFYLLASNLL